MSKPFTDEEMMVLAQLSYKDPYIKAKGYNLSLYDMLLHEESYLISSLGEDKFNIIAGLKDKVRGKDYYVVASANDKHGTGFAALAIEGPDENTVTVACRGTEGFSMDYDSSKDVYADAQLGFEKETNQQRKMNQFMKQFDSYDSIYLTGHSLGGNLAVSGAIGFAHPEKIKGVVTFNCPGQNIDFIEANAMKIMILQEKITNYQNEQDWVSDINVQIGEVIVLESQGDDFADNHCQVGFVISEDGTFERVPGNKKDKIHEFADVFIDVAVLVIDKFTNLEILVYAILNVVIFVNFVADNIEKIKTWFNKNFNPGYKYAANNPQVTVNTIKLRDYASRINDVNRRITNLDGRMDSLYWRVGLLDLWNLMQADIMTGYSWRLLRCSSYLYDTASEFESAEREISNKT